nr:OmpA family protein [Campylobacter sp.]
LLILIASLVLFSGCSQFGLSKNQIPIDKDNPTTIFVLDVSGSMNGYDKHSKQTMIESAKKNIKDIVLTLDTNKTNLTLVEFGANCEVSTSIPTTNNSGYFIQNVNPIKAYGSTPLAQAIQKTKLIAKDSNTAVHIIILSDGIETCGGNPLNEMQDLIKQNPNIKISTFILGYDVDSSTRQMLTAIAKVGNGMYFDVKNSAQMANTLNKITSQLNIVQNGWENGIYDFKINFDHNSAKIKSKFKNNIKRLATYLIQSGNKAQIQGHTDNLGNKQYNKTLSQKRANAVKKELVKLGVSKDKIKAIGYGEERPLVKNNSKQNRYKNRRVEAHIL